jgi:hypothetical protein
MGISYACLASSYRESLLLAAYTARSPAAFMVPDIEFPSNLEASCRVDIGSIRS